MGQRACALRNKAPNSASAALDRTWHMIRHNMWIWPLSGGAGLAEVGGEVGCKLKKE